MTRWSDRCRIGTALVLAACSCLATARAQEVAFTWDDLPSHSALPPGDTRLGIAQAILGAMKAEGMPPAYGFVNGIRTSQEPGTEEVLAAWRAAGLPLGNHTWSHMNLNDHTAAEFEADLQRNEPLLQKYMGPADWHWLRYPFLAEGRTPEQQAEVRAYLAAHGYRVAAVTVSFGDYAWNEPYARCVARHDRVEIAKLEASYLEAARETIAYTRSLSRSLYGRDIPYVLLMHVGALDARLLPRLLALYREQGFRFVTLEQAQADPFYAQEMNLSLPPGRTTLEANVAARHLALPSRPALPDFSGVCR